MPISRHDYMQDSARLHQSYMMQFVTPEVLARVRSCSFYSAILQSSDKHLNDIPLSKWEGLMLNPPSSFTQRLEQLGEWNTPSLRVCVAKEAARSIKDTAIVPNYHVIKVTYLGATNSLGSRVKLTSERFEKDSITLCRDYRCSSLEQSAAFLNQCEFAIVGTAEGRGCSYILTSTFKRLTRE